MELRAYKRNTDGTLDYTTVLMLDGQPCCMGGYPLTRTADSVELMGWPDAECDVYTTDGGVEVLVPRKV